jgi:2-polyprenyl-3-methyl-5-hydroxy-6-metoxy-1,4-benzoquinol methylase
VPEHADGDPHLDDLLALLRQRVDDRRRQGVYPAGLEETLDEHFERLVGERPRPSPAETHAELDLAVKALIDYEYSSARIDPASELPGGRLAHRVIGKAVSRQVEGVLQQTREHAALVTRAIALLEDIAASIGHEFDTKVLQQLDDLQVRVAEQARSIRRLEQELHDARERLPGAMVEPWYDGSHFTLAFRGTEEALCERYEDLAREFVGFDPVLDVGFGNAEFMRLLRDLGVTVRGVEADPELVERARGFGFDVELGLAVEHLRGLEAASLGGLVMLQVVEHLTPQQLIDLVQLVGQKVRPGGKVVVETVNPTSLFTYTSAFWVDPDHVRPVAPAFLAFLFREAGFSEPRIVLRSPVADDERLTLLPGDDDATRRINENFEHLNSVVFGPQDYALIALR